MMEYVGAVDWSSRSDLGGSGLRHEIYAQLEPLESPRSRPPRGHTGALGHPTCVIAPLPA